MWPDNKVIEDLHNVIRADTKKTHSSKRSAVRKQDVAIASKVLDSRDVTDTSKVTLEHWLRDFHKPHPPRRRTQHHSATHRLSRKWAAILGRKTWHTTSEVETRKSVAAWQWLQCGHTHAQSEAAARGLPSPTLDRALFSRLVPSDCFLQCPDGSVAASMGNGTWAVLLYPVDVLASAQDNGLRILKMRTRDARCWFAHIVDPRRWMVLNHDPEMWQNQIVAREHSAPTPLVEFFWRRSRELSLEILTMLAQLYDIDDAARRTRPSVLRALCDHVFRDEPTTTSVLQQDSKSCKDPAPSTLLQDPLFEAAFEDMGDDDKFEFPDLRKEHVRGRVSRHVAQRKVVAAQRGKRRRDGQLLRQRRANARDGGETPPIAAPQTPQAAPAPQPPSPPPPPAQAPARLAPAQRNAASERNPRGTPWGPHFTLAPSYREGRLYAITVTCKLHVLDGMRCNKNLALGPHMSEEDATHRIKEWCCRGLDVADGIGARHTHMCSWNPRHFSQGDLRPMGELDALVGAC